MSRVEFSFRAGGYLLMWGILVSLFQITLVTLILPVALIIDDVALMLDGPRP